jgi:hypothetical protein
MLHAIPPCASSNVLRFLDALISPPVVSTPRRLLHFLTLTLSPPSLVYYELFFANLSSSGS